jgi:beta-lactamase class A
VLPGLRPTIGQLSTLMLAVSDNAATNALIERVGLAAVEAEGARLGLRATRVRRRMIDPDAVAAGRDNVTSAGDLAALCRALADPARVPRPAAWRTLEGLRAGQHLDLLGEVVPQEAVLGLKRGWNDDASNDCALVLAPSGPVGLAVCSSPPAAPDALRRAAREALATAGISPFSRGGA